MVISPIVSRLPSEDACFSHSTTARHLTLLECNIALAALVLRQGELAPAGLRRIEDAVGQRLLRQRLPARRPRRWEEFCRRTDRIEVFADHRAIEEVGAVVGNERGHLG